ncbi:hypothetical protein RRF68_03505 [Tenacibaculum sp. HL-MS23]|uniref:hypothetical protein n=1 Tax=unclassified Tenacibaculum TaxID=2635139 RepID=UPI001C4FFACD|nr:MULTISPECIES: hypothetical protein [unclassified Tenacibaculum]QXP73689.1 hypothetical protein H0I30_00685 [Tenacibaculum sp. AHE14PA]QXP75944.1 hypothetical protein H0I31_12295 [Tenacibaculum sp. AHE15PA]WNW02505.1 hypothetical protein RRF68_03505 [Tenacibaculum sp. HL-MS23]
MKKGIIIIFNKSDINILKTSFLKSFINQGIKILLINNGNHQAIIELLCALKEYSKKDISILTLRKEKKAMLAVKAGVRFLSTINNIGLIIHTKPMSMLNISFINKILNISEKDLFNKKEERVLLRRVYSINEIINC